METEEPEARLSDEALKRTLEPKPESGPPADPERWLQAAAERLVSLYEAWGKPARAAEWRSRLSELGARHAGITN